MLRTNLVRRAGRLLGAVTATGVLSLGLFAASPMAAQACPQVSHAGASTNANGIGTSTKTGGSTGHGLRDWANGI